MAHLWGYFLIVIRLPACQAQSRKRQPVAVSWDDCKLCNADGAGRANQDSNAVARDQVYIVRNTHACSSKLGSRAAAPARAAAGSSISQLLTAASSGG